MNNNFSNILLTLPIDEAVLYFETEKEVNESIFLYGIHDDCEQCSLNYLYNLSNGDLLTFSTHYFWDFRLRSDGIKNFISKHEIDNYTLCNFRGRLYEHGIYTLNQNCILETLVQPINCTLPLYIIFGIISVFLFLILGIKSLLKIDFEFLQRLRKIFGLTNKENINSNEMPSSLNRISCIDTFRGISIVLMIFVNDGGGKYYFMEHATWNGLYVADLAFPWFLWIMGFCIPLSLRSLFCKKMSLSSILKNILKRSLVLFLLGIMMNSLGNTALETIRIPGVLQRFAICYFVVASTSAFSFLHSTKISSSSFADIWSHWIRWLVMACILGSVGALQFFISLPDCHEIEGCKDGVYGYIDRLLLTSSHMYSASDYSFTYHSQPFDPEGILGTLNAILSVFGGYQGGLIILCHANHKKRLLRFFYWSLLNAICGLALSQNIFQKGFIPINKNLWSWSYVCITTSLAFFFFFLLYISIDVYGLWKGAPFYYAGHNSLLLYLGHTVASDVFPFHWRIGQMNSHWLTMGEAIWGVLLWLLLAYILFKKKFFLKV